MSGDAHQILAADPNLSVFVTANAGSGKTTTLVCLLYTSDAADE